MLIKKLKYKTFVPFYTEVPRCGACLLKIKLGTYYWTVKFLTGPYHEVCDKCLTKAIKTLPL